MLDQKKMLVVTWIFLLCCAVLLSSVLYLLLVRTGINGTDMGTARADSFELELEDRRGEYMFHQIFERAWNKTIHDYIMSIFSNNQSISEASFKRVDKNTFMTFRVPYEGSGQGIDPTNPNVYARILRIYRIDNTFLMVEDTELMQHGYLGGVYTPELICTP